MQIIVAVQGRNDSYSCQIKKAVIKISALGWLDHMYVGSRLNAVSAIIKTTRFLSMPEFSLPVVAFRLTEQTHASRGKFQGHLKSVLASTNLYLSRGT